MTTSEPSDLTTEMEADLVHILITVMKQQKDSNLVKSLTNAAVYDVMSLIGLSNKDIDELVYRDKVSG